MDRWDADVDAAVEQAVPCRWEVREVSWQTAGSWQALPKDASAQLTALARRGQRRGNVTAGVRELVVDLNDMVAVPAGARHGEMPMHLRRSASAVGVDKRVVKQFYMRYADPLPPDDHLAGPDGVHGEKFVQLFQDIGVDPGTDVTALAIACACQAKEMGVFRRREFICGCVAMGVDSLDALRHKVPQLRSGLSSITTLEEVYAYTFGVALEPPSKVLPLEEAIAYWALLLPQWTLREAFCEWATQHMKVKSINRDVWSMVFRFATECPPDLSTYDENPAWPVVIDDFVEYHRAQGL